jgi:hypothetical protein
MKMSKLALAVSLALSGAPAPAAVVTQYTYSITCKPNPAYSLWGDCSTLEHLWERARVWSRTAPRPLTGGTPETPSIVLVSSTTIPVSAIFRFYQPPPVQTSRGTFTPMPQVSYFQPASSGNLEVNALAMANLDRQVTSTRALKIHPIRVPPSLGRANATSNVGIINQVNSILERQSSGLDFLWGLAGYHMPQTKYIDVIDDRSGEQHRIFEGDTITIEFSDLSTITVQAVNNGTQNALVFVVVQGSARDPSGKPYTVVPKPAKPGNGAIWMPSAPNVDARLLGPGPSCLFPAGQVCTSSLNVYHCRNTRSYVGPC